MITGANRWLGLAFITLMAAGCVEHEEPVESAYSADIASQTYAESDLYWLKRLGFTCSTVSVGTVYCYKCYPDGGCNRYQCVNGSCHTCGTLVGDPPCVGASERSEQFHFFEAEDGALITPLAKTEANGASKGAALTLTTAGSTSGRASYSLNIATAGNFNIWARIKAPSEQSNAIKVQLGSNAALTWTTPVTGASWLWTQFQVAGKPHEVALAQGYHTLRIYGVDPGTLIDRVMVTDNLQFVPRVMEFEAGSGGFVPPMQRGTELGIPSTTYTWVPYGHGPGGLATILTPVPQEGSYAVWARTSGSSEGHDSLELSASLQPGVRWDVPHTPAGAWAWSRVVDSEVQEGALFQLAGSSPFINVYATDDGIKVDKILVTNDLGFAPVEPTSTSVPPSNL